ncbi:MAG TPA: hypothetical protein HPP76_09730 [Desulfuromonadales bacterium]|nr:hypothetical protein [Desulfuromonadales bacterium]
MTKVGSTKIDKNIRETIAEFNRSRHLKTVFCCAGHKKDKDSGMQVYVMFEMKKKHLPEFLAQAFEMLSYKMSVATLHAEVSRVSVNGWPQPKKERISISFGGLRDDLQLKLARDYFKRLAAEVVKAGKP